MVRQACWPEAHRRAHARIVEELTRVHSEEVADDQQQDDAADAEPPDTTRPKPTAAHAAAIFDVLTLSRVVHAHGGPSVITERWLILRFERRGAEIGG